MDTTYSNLSGDFIVTPVDGTKQLVFSAVEEPLVLSKLTFTSAVIRRLTVLGLVETLPVDDFIWDIDTLTLNDMTGNFVSTDQVSVTVTGAPRGFFVVAENVIKEVLNVAEKKVIGPEYAATPFSGGATLVVNPAESMLDSGWVLSKDTSLTYLQVHNTIALPATGAVPLYREPIEAQQKIKLPKMYLSTGLTLVVSLTKDTYTAVSTPTNFEMGGLYV